MVKLSMSDAKDYIIQCENLIKIYKNKDIEVMALQGLDFNVEKGELMAIIGNSGSGKTTLLNMIGGFDKATMGKIFIDGKDLFKMNEYQLMKYKRSTIGIVWQNNARNLIPYLTALENVEFPMIISGTENRRRQAKQLLEAVGMGKRMNNRLSQLSGGELQRVAICIAMANHPKILMADEPTGSVDSKTTDQIMDVFRDLNKNMGVTVVIVTHDRQVSKKVDRVVAISDGRISSEFIKKQYVLAEEEDTHNEFAIIDKSRRLQLPSEFIDKLNVGKQSMVCVGMSEDTIVISAPKSALDTRLKAPEVRE